MEVDLPDEWRVAGLQEMNVESVQSTDSINEREKREEEEEEEEEKGLMENTRHDRGGEETMLNGLGVALDCDTNNQEGKYSSMFLPPNGFAGM